MTKYIITFLLMCDILKAAGCTVLSFSETDYPNASKICKTFAPHGMFNVDNCLMTKNVTNIFKLYGVAHCLKVDINKSISLTNTEAQSLAPTFGYSVKTDVRADMIRFQILCGAFSFDIDSPLKELKSYIEKAYPEHKISKTLTVENVAECLEIHNSQEYQVEVEKIIKKYCKNCREKYK